MTFKELLKNGFKKHKIRLTTKEIFNNVNYLLSTYIIENFKMVY